MDTSNNPPVKVDPVMVSMLQPFGKTAKGQPQIVVSELDKALIVASRYDVPRLPPRGIVMTAGGIMVAPYLSDLAAVHTPRLVSVLKRNQGIEDTSRLAHIMADEGMNDSDLHYIMRLCQDVKDADAWIQANIQRRKPDGTIDPDSKSRIDPALFQLAVVVVPRLIRAIREKCHVHNDVAIEANPEAVVQAAASTFRRKFKEVLGVADEEKPKRKRK